MVGANSAGSEASESDFERRFAAGRDFSVPMGGWVARWIAIRRSWWETLCVGWVAGGRGMRSFDSVWRAHSYISIWFIHSIRTFDSFEDANSRVDARRLISARCNSPQFASTFDCDGRLAGNGQWARMMGAGDGRRWWARRSVKLRFAPRTQFEHTELLWLFFLLFSVTTIFGLPQFAFNWLLPIWFFQFFAFWLISPASHRPADHRTFTQCAIFDYSKLEIIQFDRDFFLWEHFSTFGRVSPLG